MVVHERHCVWDAREIPEDWHGKHAGQIYFAGKKAQERADFLKIGMKGDVQSINVVNYPARLRSA